MASSFSFKLDPSSLPQLTSKGDNYPEWRAAWTIAFKYAELWNIVSNATARPVAGPSATAEETARVAQLSKDDNKALVMIMSAVHTDLVMLVTTASSSNQAWMTLQDRFDRDTAHSTIQQFRQLTTMRYREDSNDLANHLDNFHQMWTNLERRCKTSEHELAKNLATVFASDSIKGSFFLSTLPESMDTIVDNLSTRGVNKFAEIEPKMLDIAFRHNQPTDERAYYTKTSGKPNRRDKQTSSTSGNTRDECTWCRKHNFTFVGHIYTDCTRLAEHKNRQRTRNDTNKPRDNPDRNPNRPKGKHKAHQAVATSDDDSNADSDDQEDVQAFVANCQLTETETETLFDRRSATLGREQTTVDLTEDDEYVHAFAVNIDPHSLPYSPSTWIFDSGASRHMSGHQSDFVDLRPRTGTISIAGGAKLPVEGIGSIRLMLKLPDGGTQPAIFTDVLYSRHLLGTRLFSWSHVRHNFQLNGQGNDIHIRSRGGKCVMWAKFHGGGFTIQTDNVPYGDEQANFASYKDFHQAVGHIRMTRNTAQRLYADGQLVPAEPPDWHCHDCEMAKSTRRKPVSVVHTDERAKEPFDVIHTDLSGQFSTPSLAKSRYFIPFLDEKTRYVWVRFAKTKTDIPVIINDFIHFVQTHHNVVIKFFHTDGGGEFTGQATQTVLRLTGTRHRVSPPYHHESNGRIERYMRTIVTDARTIIVDDSLFLWPEAISHAAYVKNIKPHRGLTNGITPHEALTGNKPSVGYLKPYFSDCYLHIPKEARQPGTKLQDRAERAKLVGYDSPSVMRLYVPARHVVTTATVSHVRFVTAANKVHWDLEESRTHTQAVSDRPAASLSQTTSSHTTPVVKRQTTSESVPRLTTPTSSPSRIPISRRRERTAATPEDTATVPGRTRSGRPYLAHRADTHDCSVADADDDEPLIAFAMLAVDDDIPLTLRQALKSPESTHWKNAVDAELSALVSKDVWTETPLPRGKPVVTPRWVFAKKHDAQGRLVRYKARLVARGFTQIHGWNYDETYSPVARYDSLRLIIRLAAMNKWWVHQMDVETAYLYSNLRHEVYLTCPDGYTPRSSTPVVLRLQKALYGLKQSGREWFGTLKSTMDGMNMIPIPSDPCVFRRDNLIVGVYIDDIVLTGTTDAVNSFKSVLATQYKCKDLGICRYLFGLEINQTERSVEIGQSGYATRILKRFGMDECNGRDTPLDAGLSLPRSTDDDERTNVTEYQQISGSLNFLVTGSRPDLAFPVSMMSSYNADPNTQHLSSMKQILRYLSRTTNRGLEYKRTNNAATTLEVFADASYNSDPDTAKSVGAYVVRLNDATVAWSSRKQTTVAKSTCEAEYMACSEATSQLLWTRQLLMDLGVNIDVRQTVLWCDNNPAVELTHNDRVTFKSRHIAPHYHFVRQHHGSSFVVRHISSHDNTADICTKALARPLFQKHVKALGMTDVN